MSLPQKTNSFISSSECLYVKLGMGGQFEQECLEKGTVKLSYSDIDHQSCMDGKWDEVMAICLTISKNSASAKTHLNQIKSFYEAGEDVLWFTFAKGKLFWAFANSKVELLKDGTKIRRVRGKWSSKDLNGKELLISNLSGKLTRTQGYRQTICKCKVSDYLIRRINGLVLPQVEEAQKAYSHLEQAIEKLISDLTPQDFELIVELVFSNTGWIRVGQSGGTERDIDLELISPITNEKVAVQVKSKADQAMLDEYIERFAQWDVDQFFFVYHTSEGKIAVKKEDEKNVKVVGSKKLATLVVNAGLASWLIDKSA